MSLRKWGTSDPQLQDIFNEMGPVIVTEGQAVPMPRETKVLGMVWNIDTDQFRYATDSVISILTEDLDTNRIVLRTTSRI